MTVRKLNYTGVKKILVGDINLAVDHSSPELKIIGLSVNSDVLTPKDELVLTLYQSPWKERMSLGPLVGGKINAFPNNGRPVMPFLTSKKVTFTLEAKNSDNRWVARSSDWSMFGGPQEGDGVHKLLKIREDKAQTSYRIELPLRNTLMSSHPTIEVALSEDAWALAFGEEQSDVAKKLLFRGVLAEIFGHLRRRVVQEGTVEEESWELWVYRELLTLAAIEFDDIHDVQEDELLRVPERVVEQMVGGGTQW